MLALFNRNTLIWWLKKGCMGQRFASSVNAVVWIAELVHVNKVGS